MVQILSGQLFTMFLMILVGYVIFRTHLSDHEGNRTISNILLMVVNPAMILSSILSIEYSAKVLHGLMISVLLGFLSHLVVIAVTHLLLGRADAHSRIGMERFMTVYSNCGFMGIPLVSSVFGAEAVLYLTGYLIPNNILTWTHGVMQITGKTSPRQVLKGLMSPTVICVVIGVVCFLLRIGIEPHLMQAINYIGAMTTPMGMFVAGTALAETGLHGIWKNPRLFYVTALKLIAAPAATCFMLILMRKMIPFSDTIFYAILIPSACPSATTGTMMALRYNKDYQYSSQVFVVSTLLSILSIPAVTAVVRLIAG